MTGRGESLGSEIDHARAKVLPGKYNHVLAFRVERPNDKPLAVSWE